MQATATPRYPVPERPAQGKKGGTFEPKTPF
jgi:hypothetical protein